MASSLQPPRGIHDLLPEAAAQHRFVCDTARAVAALYGFAEVVPPMFEFSDVFHRTLGDTSDVVTKETYSFTDRGGESLTLRPEFTASIARMFITHSLQQSVPAKFFYAGPAFRYERPQKGRQRQFHQIGAEIMGAAEVEADLEALLLARRVLDMFGLLPYATLEINSLGDAASRAAYRETLVGYLQKHRASLSAESQVRLEKNPLRVLDSKSEEDRKIVADAPSLIDSFTQEAAARFAKLQELLTLAGVAFTVSPRLVRGLDYYSHTVFEFTTDKLGAQGTILAGGRYDQLLALMGDKETPSIGWAAGVERLVALMEAAGTLPAMVPVAEIAVVPLMEAAEGDALMIAEMLRAAGHRVELAYKGNPGKRLKRADKLGCCLAVILGEEELAQGFVTVKQMQVDQEKATQMRISRDELLAKIAGILE